MLALKITATYLIVSFIAGLGLMMFDTATGHRHEWMFPAVNILYLPPLCVLAVFACFGVVQLFVMIWS